MVFNIEASAEHEQPPGDAYCAFLHLSQQHTQVLILEIAVACIVKTGTTGSTKHGLFRVIFQLRCLI